MSSLRIDWRRILQLSDITERLQQSVTIASQVTSQISFPVHVATADNQCYRPRHRPAYRSSKTAGRCKPNAIKTKKEADLSLSITKELNHLTNSFTQLKQAQAKFKACIDNVNEVKPENKGMPTVLLIFNK